MDTKKIIGNDKAERVPGGATTSVGMDIMDMSTAPPNIKKYRMYEGNRAFEACKEGQRAEQFITDKNQNNEIT